MRAIVSLGSNVEPRGEFLSRALAALAALPETRLARTSSVIETEPVDVPPEFAALKFLNQVAVFETALEVHDFSRRMHLVEDALGRVRTVRNGPRTIDLDLVDFGGLRLDEPGLTLPHPRAHLRDFVLKPLAELGINDIMSGREKNVPMLSIRFHVNEAKPRAGEMLAHLAERARALGLAVVADGRADVIVVLGGDGTFLRAVHEYPGVPLLGLNLGGLGYLCSVEERDFDEALARLAAGQYSVSERRMIEADGKFAALNDIVIMREMSGHSTRLDLAADGRSVTHYMADGLIFATPTGSTAYSLSAGGPVLMPDSGNIVVTPMNPHALGVRPLVVRDTVRFTVTARSRTAGNAMKIGVYADGENVLTLDEGESVEIAHSAQTAKLVEMEGYDPYDVLTRKLGWSGSNVK